MAVQVERVRFTVDDYHRMAEAGILSEDDRVELIDGEIVRMSPIGNRHAWCVRRLVQLLTRRTGDHEAIVDSQNPIRLGPYSEPQPDVVVLRFREDYYPEHPTPTDVLLVIEVADTSLAYDRQVKLPLYAQAGIPEVWLVDLTGDAIERHSEPSEGGYRRVERVGRGETLVSLSLPSLTLRVDDVLA